MEVINLPQDIGHAKNDLHDGIIIHPYSAKIGSFRGKSILHTNAISLVISGEKTMHFASKTLNIKNDEIHFLSAGNCMASVNLSGHQIFKSILIFFNDKVLSDFYVKYASLTSKIKRFNTKSREPFISFRKDRFIINFITSLEYILAGGETLSAEMRLLKFEELMLYLLENHPETILSFKPSKGRDLNDLEIRKVVETNLTNIMGLEDLAFLCNMSLSTFKRRFANIYGTSPNKWILHRRIELAKHLLHHHREKPGDVYHKVGYENHSSFSQSFKQIVGLTPRDFQMQQLNVQQ